MFSLPFPRFQFVIRTLCSCTPSSPFPRLPDSPAYYSCLHQHHFLYTSTHTRRYYPFLYNYRVMTDTEQVAVDNAREQNGELKENGSSSSSNARDEKMESLCGKGGEWENRKISIMGVVKRFISQLSYGQDLTRCHSITSMHHKITNPLKIQI
jgi:hypothetical protein